VKYLFYITIYLFSVTIFSQNIIKGIVVDEKNIPIPNANIIISKKNVVVTDFNGEFSISTTKKFPYTIEVSKLGFVPKKAVEIKEDEELVIVLEEDLMVLNQVVISASRSPEKIGISPFSIEKISNRDLEKSINLNFFSMLENIKSLDVNYSSIRLASLNTRGFASFSNTRFLQRVEGMDTSSPSLNFSIGNIIGLNELDILSVELLPGTSSGIYGANAFNGMLSVNSKNPFEYSGTSSYAKFGIINASNLSKGNGSFYDFGFRHAKKYNDNIAIKITFSHYEGDDWAATDDNMYGNYRKTQVNPGAADLIRTRGALPYAHNALNKYGDETARTLTDMLKSLQEEDVNKFIASNLLLSEDKEEFFGSEEESDLVGLEGYWESDLYDDKARNTKTSIAFHYRPNGNSSGEFIFLNKIGTGNFLYQGRSRYALKNYMIRQHKIEYKTNKLLLRGYATIEDSENSYDLEWTGIKLNESYADNFYRTYILNYIQNRVPFLGGTIDNNAEAHRLAREEASEIKLLPKTVEFNNLFNQIINDTLYKGSKLIAKTDMFHFDLNYKFKEIIPFADTQIGGTYRIYDLDSDGKVFTDLDNTSIKVREYGLYLQSKKRIFNKRLNMIGSLRIDGASNFNINLSPRFSIGFTPDKKRIHNFRATYQTGFKYPTLEDQYLGLETPNTFFMGNSLDNYNRVSIPRENNLVKNFIPTSPDESIEIQGIALTSQIRGNNIKSNSWTLNSFLLYNKEVNSKGQNAETELLKKATLKEIEPEKIYSFEIGYKGIILENIYLDIAGYYNQYKNFISSIDIVAPNYGDIDLSNKEQYFLGKPKAIVAIEYEDYQIFTLPYNTSTEVELFGLDVGADTKIKENIHIGLNYSFLDVSFDQMQDTNFEARFNTPKHRIKGYINMENIFKGLGFGISGRWNTEYLWESDYINAIIPERFILDAQISYKIFNSILKIQGTNILQKEYVYAPGTGLIGSQFFLSWHLNI